MGYDSDPDDDDVGVTFELTAGHVRLLRAGVFHWNGVTCGLSHAGGPAGADAALARVLGLDPDDVTPRQMRALRDTARATETALEVVLATGGFEPGSYRLRDPHQRMSWERVPTVTWWANSPSGPVQLTAEEAADDVDAWSKPVGTGP